MYGQGAQALLLQKFVGRAFPLANLFFHKYFVAKKLASWRNIVSEKCTIDGYAY